MTSLTPGQLHPSENRGYRELYVRARHLERHWARLADRWTAGPAAGAFESGRAAASALNADLPPAMARYGLPVGAAAGNLGGTLSLVRNEVGDRLLERGQAVRLAVTDVQQMTTLLAYLRRIAERRGDAELAGFGRRHLSALEEAERAVRDAAAACGDDPDGAIEPLDSSMGGRAGQRLNYTFGAIGEWLDQRATNRR